MPRGGCRDGGLSGARAANALRTCSGDGSSSWAEMAAGADVLGICITTAEAVQKLALGPDGLLSHMREGAVFLDHTTVSPDHVDRMREACAALNIAYCEAPMTRTPVHADRGEVNILFGGSEDLLERLRPLFETYAENIFHVGPAGHAIRSGPRSQPPSSV